MDLTKKITEALVWRRATKIFDPTKKVSDEDLHTILSSAHLAPSVFGIEPWKFLVITNPELRTKLRAASYDQPKVTDASHLVIITRRTDAENMSQELILRTMKAQNKKEEDMAGLKGAVDGAVTAHTEGPTRDGWIAGQTYIPLGMMIETASLLGIDNGPMEGFDPNKVAEILNLKEKNLFPVSMLALGYRGDDAYSHTAKVRREFDEVVEFI